MTPGRTPACKRAGPFARRLPRLRLLALVLASVARPASAQEPDSWQGRQVSEVQVSEVEIVGLKTLNRDSVLHYLGLEPGRRFVPGQLDAGLQALWSTGLIDDVSSEVLADEASRKPAVRIVVTVIERPRLAAIVYPELERLVREELEGEIERRDIELEPGRPLRIDELYRLERALEELFAREGYPFARATPQFEPLADHTVKVRLQLERGARVIVGRVAFEGNHQLADRELRGALQELRSSDPLQRLLGPSVFDRSALDRDRERLRARYRDLGFKDVVIGEPRVTMDGGDGSGDGGGKRARADVTFPIDEGERWRLGEVSLEGNQLLGDQFLLGEIDLPSDGWLDAAAIDQARLRLSELYGSRGYVDARVEASLRERAHGEAGARADVVFEVDEGAFYRVGRIEFEGNSRTREGVLRRELGLYEGEVLDSTRLHAGLARLERSGTVELDPRQPLVLDYDGERRLVDVELRAREVDVFYPELGGGYSRTDGGRLRASLRVKNPFGLGEAFLLALVRGERESSSRLGFSLPWVSDRPQDLAFELFDEKLDFEFPGENGERSQAGARLSYRFRLGDRADAYATYTYLDQEDSVASSGSVLEQRRRSALRLGLRFDDHDHPIEPTRGRRLHVSLEYAGGPLGGQVSTLEPRLELTLSRPQQLGRLRSLARLNFEAGWIEPLDQGAGGPSSLSPFDRYFLGGENSLRGFPLRSIRLRDPATAATLLDEYGQPRGGDSFFQLNLEYHLIPRGPVRLVLFTDLGQVLDGRSSLSLDPLRASAGLELRVRVPKLRLPLRLIYAEDLNPLAGLTPADQQAFDRFGFSLGINF